MYIRKIWVCRLISFLFTEFVQDAASKGLYLVYNSSGENNRESLVSNLLDQFVHGRRDGIKVTADTVLFENNEMGKSPLGWVFNYKHFISKYYNNKKFNSEIEKSII